MPQYGSSTLQVSCVAISGTSLINISAELAPAEVRGSLVALQQLAITFGIMISCTLSSPTPLFILNLRSTVWIDYGTQFIGGTGAGQTAAAWRIPLALQLVPAIILGIGINFMPFSPRWLISEGREEEAIEVLSNARSMPKESDLVQIEFLEIKAQHLFEKATSEELFPMYQDGGVLSEIKLGFWSYFSLLQKKSTYFVGLRRQPNLCLI